MRSEFINNARILVIDEIHAPSEKELASINTIILFFDAHGKIKAYKWHR